MQFHEIFNDDSKEYIIKDFYIIEVRVFGLNRKGIQLSSDGKCYFRKQQKSYFMEQTDYMHMIREQNRTIPKSQCVNRKCFEVMSLEENQKYLTGIQKNIDFIEQFIALRLKN